MKPKRFEKVVEWSSPFINNFIMFVFILILVLFLFSPDPLSDKFSFFIGAVELFFFLFIWVAYREREVYWREIK